MKRLVIVIALAALSSLPSLAGTVSLKQKFIDTYKDRATITAQMTIRHAHKQPNSVVLPKPSHTSTAFRLPPKQVPAASPSKLRRQSLTTSNSGLN
jgi:hypothetical protein